MRVRPQVPQAEAAAWGQVRVWGGGDGGGHPRHHGLAGGAGGGRGAAPLQEERGRLCRHGRQAPEDLRRGEQGPGLMGAWAAVWAGRAWQLLGAGTMTDLSQAASVDKFWWSSLCSVVSRDLVQSIHNLHKVSSCFNSRTRKRAPHIPNIRFLSN